MAGDEGGWDPKGPAHIEESVLEAKPKTGKALDKFRSLNGNASSAVTVLW
ncbi:hypothetical protein Ptr86124_010243 [Pyrenophora tritici-repentis]|uniref:Uncharacterized protein n=1 Tax=Pyrenophora tritici-repentis TaxID=45151 RepID=A0A922SXW2_9PLEO|nr:hypothetical protein Ptr86124_010243 [Pyrenophora tritici-repentis]